MITFTTCWYRIESKYPLDIYQRWIQLFLSNVKFNLVIYTDKNSLGDVQRYESKNVIIVIKEIEDFYNYRYRDFWINNHGKNCLINQKSSWILNMLWSEKISFVCSTMDNNYFDSEWHAWCDIGYFRCRSNDISVEQLRTWPDYTKIANLDKNKIHYACIDPVQTEQIFKQARIINDIGLPATQLPANQTTVAGGMFLIHNSMCRMFNKLYNKYLKSYFDNKYLVKDDQIILSTIMANHMDNFQLYYENNRRYDKWFMFQRVLLP